MGIVPSISNIPISFFTIICVTLLNIAGWIIAEINGS